MNKSLKIVFGVIAICAVAFGSYQLGYNSNNKESGNNTIEQGTGNNNTVEQGTGNNNTVEQGDSTILSLTKEQLNEKIKIFNGIDDYEDGTDDHTREVIVGQNLREIMKYMLLSSNSSNNSVDLSSKDDYDYFKKLITISYYKINIDTDKILDYKIYLPKDTIMPKYKALWGMNFEYDHNKEKTIDSKTYIPFCSSGNDVFTFWGFVFDAESITYNKGIYDFKINYYEITPGDYQDDFLTNHTLPSNKTGEMHVKFEYKDNSVRLLSFTVEK